MYKTPGVYVIEQNAFGSSIIENQTAVPVFLGFTEFAKDGSGKPINKLKGSTLVTEPVAIRSLLEYQNAFGGPDTSGTIYLTKTTDANGKVHYQPENKNAEGSAAYTPGLMHPAVENYFSNGGGFCYIISMGSYTDFSPSLASTISNEMNYTEQAIQMATETTLIVPTDFIRFGATNYYKWGTQLTDFSGQEKKYFSILDVIQDPTNTKFNTSDIDNYRSQMNSQSPSYAAAYYPYLKSLTAYAYKTDYSNVFLDGNPLLSAPTEEVEQVKAFLSTNYIHLPPSPFMAGIYSQLDRTSGVWTPPANVAPVGVTTPVVPISNDQQEGLNVDQVTGKSINAIRSFVGRGTLVWGARTNDGNSMDWRYINVRRLCIAIETDITLALEAYVFKPNVHNTWVEVKTSIESYLYGLYTRGAFVGPTPDSSYQVMVGLGSTMTSEDVLNGNMIVSIMVAPVRPAEFVVLTFSQIIGQ